MKRLAVLVAVAALLMSFAFGAFADPINVGGTMLCSSPINVGGTMLCSSPINVGGTME